MRQHCNYRIKFFATAILIEHKLFLHLSRLFREPPPCSLQFLTISTWNSNRGKKRITPFAISRNVVLYGRKFQRIRLRRVDSRFLRARLNRAKRGECRKMATVQRASLRARQTKFHDNDVINFYNRETSEIIASVFL